MRLINADDLIDGYKHMGYDPTEQPEESYMEGWCNGFNAAVDHCISHVIHAQTIEPLRIKGHWIDKGCGEYRCSNCRDVISIEDEIMINIDRIKYCPYCGSDNGRGEQDGQTN